MGSIPSRASTIPQTERGARTAVSGPARDVCDPLDAPCLRRGPRRSGPPPPAWEDGARRCDVRDRRRSRPPPAASIPPRGRRAPLDIGAGPRSAHLHGCATARLDHPRPAWSSGHATGEPRSHTSCWASPTPLSGRDARGRGDGSAPDIRDTLVVRELAALDEHVRDCRGDPLTRRRGEEQGARADRLAGALVSHAGDGINDEPALMHDGDLKPDLTPEATSRSSAAPT